MHIAEALQKLFSFGRGILVLIILLVLGIILKSLPLKAKETLSGTMLSTVFYPAQYAFSAVDDFRGILAENDSLKKQNAHLRLEVDNMREGLKELKRLRTLVRFDNKWDYPIVTTKVIGKNPGRFVTTLIINRGASDGLKTDMPVFSMKGLVGRISKISAHHAQVQVLLDPTLKFSVLNTRTRTIGFVESLKNQMLKASLPIHSGAKVGDTLVTSGLGGIYPKGIGVGIITEIQEEEQSVHSTLFIQPFQDVNHLEEVFVMQKESDWIVRDFIE